MPTSDKYRCTPTNFVCFHKKKRTYHDLTGELNRLVRIYNTLLHAQPVGDKNKNKTQYIASILDI